MPPLPQRCLCPPLTPSRYCNVSAWDAGGLVAQADWAMHVCPVDFSDRPFPFDPCPFEAPFSSPAVLAISLSYKAVAELFSELAEAALQAVGDRAGDGHIQGFGSVAREDAAPGIGVAVGFAVQLDRDPAGDVDYASDLGGWLAIFAQHRHLLLEALVVEGDYLVPAHDVRLAEQVERPAEQEQVVGSFDHIVAFQVGDCPLPGSLAALDAVHIQRLPQPPEDLFSSWIERGWI